MHPLGVVVKRKIPTSSLGIKHHPSTVQHVSLLTKPPWLSLHACNIFLKLDLELKLLVIHQIYVYSVINVLSFMCYMIQDTQWKTCEEMEGIVTICVRPNYCLKNQYCI